MSDLEPTRCGGLVVDTMARAASFEQKPVDLTRREFDILAALAAHPGWVCSSGMLANFDPAFYGSPSSISVHVARLRKKLAFVGCTGLVETVRGVGYRLNPQLSSAIRAVAFDTFVGRDRELGVLNSGLARVISAGEGGFVLITGEAGVGKSRIAEEFERNATQQGVEVLWARPVESGAPPYWSWVQVLRELVAGSDELGDPDSADEDVTLTEILRQLSFPEQSRAEAAAALSAPEATFVLHSAVTDALAVASLRRPITLVFDDLQWAGPETLELIGFALRQLGRFRVLVVGITRRTNCASTPLDRVLGEAAGRRQTACMEIEGFSRAEIRSLACAWGIHGIDAEMAEAVYNRTGGNALLVSELLRVISAEGGAENISPSQLAAFMPTPNVRNVVRGRLARLGPEANGLLEAASVLGLEFSLPVLERLCETSRDEVLDALGAAIDADILAPSDGPEQVRFRHGLVQDTIYLGIPSARRMRLHGQAGDVLAEIDDVQATRLTAVAEHYREAASAGYAEKAVEYALVAGRMAMKQFGFETATAQFDYARSLVATEAAIQWPPGLQVQAEEEWGDALVGSYHLREAGDAFRAAFSRLPATSHLCRGRLLGKLGRVLTETRDWVDAHEALQQASAELQAVPGLERTDEWRRARVAADVARMWLFYYELDRVGMEEWIAAVGEETERIANPMELADYLSVVLLWRILCDQYWPSEKTVGVSRRGLDAAVVSGSQSRLAMAVALNGYTLLWNGQLNEARLQLEKGLSESERIGAYTPLMIALAALACLDRIEGDVAAARTSALRCESRAMELGSMSEYGAMGTASLAWVALREGNVVSAREQGAKAFEAWALAPMYPFKWAAAWPLMAAALEGGDDDSAVHSARVLLEPLAQPPRGEIAVVVADALSAADAGDRPAALAGLRRAVELGRDFGYT